MYKTIFFLLLLAYSSLFAKDHKLELGLGVGAYGLSQAAPSMFGGRA